MRNSSRDPIVSLDVLVFLSWLIGGLILAGAAIGCGPTSFGDGASLVDAGTDECTGDGERCRGAALQQCVDGRFVDVDPNGCADCAPGAAATCLGDEVHACDDQGTIGPRIETCPANTCANGRCVEADTCADGTQQIYVVTDADVLLRFEPAMDAHVFTEVGPLDCPSGPEWPARGGGPSHPYSMSVDRQGRAWVLYTSGEIFRVDTTTGACSPTAWTPGTAGFQLFGMGFVAAASSSSEERLFISGGAAEAPQDGRLATIDATSFGVDVRAPLVRHEYGPELTGTGNAELFAYYPGRAGNLVARLQQQSASVQQEWPLPPMAGIPTGWAFAHWGGRFYIFVTEHDLSTITSNSRVLRLDPAGGPVDVLLSNLPFKIVGAGVSTCAPVIVN